MPAQMLGDGAPPFVNLIIQSDGLLTSWLTGIGPVDAQIS